LNFRCSIYKNDLGGVKAVETGSIPVPAMSVRIQELDFAQTSPVGEDEETDGD